MAKLSGLVEKKSSDRYNQPRPSRHFTNRALPWLLAQKPDKDHFEDILSNFHKLMLTDSGHWIPMIVHLFKDKENAYRRQFGGLSIHRNMTLKQLKALKGHFGIGDSINNYQFLGTYIKKKAPLYIQVISILRCFHFQFQSL